VNGKKLFATILFVIAIGALVWWFAEGHHPWTSTQRMVEVKQVDELFGTTTTTQKWEPHFTPGLEVIGPACAVLAGLGVWLLISARKKKVVS
jgi:hypothetical protein